MPRHLAEKILTSKSALEGERKQVTVLFADLKGSMELLADRDPEEARKILDPVLERMMEAVHRYEGTVNQVMGDGIMALFGAPLAHEDHAVRACYAALRMRQSVSRYSEDALRAQGVPIQIRVGLNSGEVVVRSIGSDLHMDYTAVGQTTHLAARMEQIATPGSVLITEDTVKLVEGYVQVKPLGPVPVKGMADPVDVYEVLGAGPARTRLQATAARGLTRFVGRGAEMEQLRRALELAGRAHGQVVAVVGEPGVGKSRLFFEFTHSHRVHGWLTLESGSVSYGKATTYLPVIDLLKTYFQIESRDDSRKVREKVSGKLVTLDETLLPTLSIFLALLDVPVDDPHWQALDPSQRRQRTLEVCRRLLLRESQVQPLVLVFEDLHWIDSETQTVLDSLVESLPTARILLLVNYRPEYRHGWGSKSYYHQLQLDPLPPESAQEVLDALLGSDPGFSGLKRLLIERTEGNPFFLEESVRTLIETKALTGERGAHRLARAVDTIQVPATVQAVLAARIDRLPPEEKRLLQSASVIGHDVPFRLLRAIAELAEDAVHRGLTHLRSAEFLYETSLFPELEYTFKHALTHEVAYQSLLRDRQRALHARIVDAVETLYADRLTEQVERLAHHALRGAVWEKAVRYLRQAGERAVARSANREAIQFFEQALALLAELPETPAVLTEALDVRIALGPALAAVKGAATEDVEASYLSARDLVERLGDDSRRFPALWGLWFFNYTSGRYPGALELGEQLLEVAQRRGDTGDLIEALHALWPTLSAMGQPVAAASYAEQGIALYDRERHASQKFVYGGHDPGVCARYHLALCRWLLGWPDQALVTLRDALRLAEELKHPLTTVITLWFAGWLHYQRGEHDDAARSSERLIALADAHGFQSWTGAATLLRHLTRGGLDAAVVTELGRRMNALSVGGAAWRYIFARCVLAELCARAGEDGAALAVLSQVTEALRKAFYGPEVLRLEAELLLRRGDAAEADCRLLLAIELARRQSARSLELRAATSLARLLDQRGEREEARRVLGDIYGWFTEGFATADLRAAKSLLDDFS